MEEIQYIAIQRGGECLSSKYINNKHKMRLQEKIVKEEQKRKEVRVVRIE